MKRRDFISRNLAVASVTATAAATLAPRSGLSAAETATPDGPRIRQSVMGWCFKPMPAVELARRAQAIGIEAVEGVPAEHYPAVTDLGMKISLVGSHGFAKGPLDPDNHAEVETKLRQGIDLAVKFNAPNVITFTGMKSPGISDQAAKRNCLECWKRVVPYAEKHGIGIVLEHLNSVDNTHPMKGHPGYWGDDLYRCLELAEEVGSDRFKVLFDIYHVQAMHGDIIRKIREHHRLIGHYHTAGNPGRGELDDRQEINYPPIMRAIRETGYQGFVAQEFIPTTDDPMQSLKHAFQVCNV